MSETTVVAVIPASGEGENPTGSHPLPADAPGADTATTEAIATGVEIGTEIGRSQALAVSESQRATEEATRANQAEAECATLRDQLASANAEIARLTAPPVEVTEEVTTIVDVPKVTATTENSPPPVKRGLLARVMLGTHTQGNAPSA